MFTLVPISEARVSISFQILEILTCLRINVDPSWNVGDGWGFFEGPLS